MGAATVLVKARPSSPDGSVQIDLELDARTPAGLQLGHDPEQLVPHRVKGDLSPEVVPPVTVEGGPRRQRVQDVDVKERHRAQVLEG